MIQGQAELVRNGAVPNMEEGTGISADDVFEVTELNTGAVVENHFDNTMSKVATGLAATALAIGALATPQAAFAADIGAGQQVFEGNCAACHAGG